MTGSIWSAGERRRRRARPPRTRTARCPRTSRPDREHGGQRRGARVLPHPAGEVADARPARVPTGRRRGRPAAPGRAAARPRSRDRGELGPAVDRGATTTRSGRGSGPRRDGDVPEDRRPARPPRATTRTATTAPRTAVHSAPLGGRARVGRPGCPRDDDPDDVERREVDERARSPPARELWRGVEYDRLDPPDGDARRRTARRSGCPT